MTAAGRLLQDSNSKEFAVPHNLALFIGRFQPFHLGHYKVVGEALRVADASYIEKVGVAPIERK